MTNPDQAAIRAARAEYARRYRAAHPEKIRQYNETYWLRRAHKAAEPSNAEDNEHEQSNR